MCTQKAYKRLLCLVLAIQITGASSVFSIATVSAEDLLDDPVLRWNAVALQAVKEDHSGTFGVPEQGGPGKTSRALAIVHAAIYDAVNSIDRTHERYLTLVQIGNASASMDAAVAVAAHQTLVALYSNQTSVFDATLTDHLVLIPNGPEKDLGTIIGHIVASAILETRENDNSDVDPPYLPGNEPGKHRVDPLNPSQPFLGPAWGAVTPFAMTSGSQFQSPPPPDLTSQEYIDAYNEVKDYGGDGVETATIRTEEQTEIGIYWGYDGTIGLGTPPRIYNQINRVIAEQQGNTVSENARLFALTNIAQADAGIGSWESKYVYNFWRPIVAIRESDEGTGPTGLGDGNPDTVGDPNWTPLGAPASNQSNMSKNFTPPFPAYPSGHATFGSANFRTVANFYGTDEIPFTFVSDELNGVTTDHLGNVRPLSPRSFDTLSEATAENAQSRIYLGIHWQFDATEGIAMGNSIADYTYENYLRPTEALPSCGDGEEQVDCISADDYDLSPSGTIPSSVHRGDTFETTFFANNFGPGNAENATLTVTIPANATLNNVLSGTCTLEGQLLTCTSLNIPANSSASVIVEFTSPEESQCPTEASFTPAVSSSDGKDYYDGNDTGETLTITVECEPENDLAVSVSVPNEAPNNLTLQLSVHGENHGPSTAANPEIVVPLLAGLTFNPSPSSAFSVQQGADIVCSPEAMAPQSSVDLTVAFNLLPALPCGTELGFDATISSDEEELNPQDNTSSTVTTKVICVQESNEDDDDEGDNEGNEEDGPSQSQGATRGKGTHEALIALSLLCERNGMNTQTAYQGSYHVRGTGNSLTRTSVVASDRIEIIDGFTRSERNIICGMKRYMTEQDPRNRKTPEFRHWVIGEIATELKRTHEEIQAAIDDPTFCEK